MQLVLDNMRLVFQAPPSFVKALDRRTAFLVPGFMFSPAYQARHWDGREHLVKKLRGEPGWFTAPVGLLDDFIKVARAEGFEFEVHDRRRLPTVGIRTVWNPEITLYPHQCEAIEEAVKDRGLATGKLLLQMPTRSGKTVVAAGIIDRLKRKTLFIVNSKMLLEQTVKSLKWSLGVPIGVIGAGVWDPGPITVASVQTLTRRIDTDEFRALASGFDLVFFDECHHIQGELWRDVMHALDAMYKIGLSATIFLNRKKEVPKGTIWIRAVCGPIEYQLSPSELIEGGFLVRPTVTVTRVLGPVVHGDTWREVYENGVVNHRQRNEAIVRRVCERHRDGMAVVVTVKELEHERILVEMMTAAGLRVAAVDGETPAKDRNRIVKAFTARRIDVLIGTVFGEAVDIPIIESVVVADGGKSAVASTQRFRNLTPAPGKTRAVLDDFADMHHRKLAEHSLARIRLYRSHDAFDLEVHPEAVDG